MLNAQSSTVDALTSPAGAVFSDDRRHRYQLHRLWDVGQVVHFCMLNPSVADEHDLDPTLTRCKGFAQRWNMAGMIITNLFPLVATFPRDLVAAKDRNGPICRRIDGTPCYLNDMYVECAAAASAFTVVGWGTNPYARKELRGEDRRMWESVLRHHKTYALGVSTNGQPKHPLYLSYECKLGEWRPR